MQNGRVHMGLEIVVVVLALALSAVFRPWWILARAPALLTPLLLHLFPLPATAAAALRNALTTSAPVGEEGFMQPPFPRRRDRRS